MDKLITSLEKKEYMIGIFLDFSKAFDTVDHSILLRKLFHCGIRGNALGWFQSYLSGRTQNVVVKFGLDITRIPLRTDGRWKAYL